MSDFFVNVRSNVKEFFLRLPASLEKIRAEIYDNVCLLKVFLSKSKNLRMKIIFNIELGLGPV